MRSKVYDKTFLNFLLRDSPSVPVLLKTIWQMSSGMLLLQAMLKSLPAEKNYLSAQETMCGCPS